MDNSKKNLLFIINNLTCGGAEKALVSLLQTIDYSRFNVDLYLFKQTGVFLNQVPKEVVLLPEPENYKYFDMSIKTAIIDNLKKGKFNVVWNRILAGFVFKSEKIKAVAEQKAWKYLSRTMYPIKKEYDVAIGFLEKTPNYFCVEKVTAKKKIGFVMNDYNKLKMDKTIDDYYFKKLDFIALDSDGSKQVMVETFPHFKDKFKVIKSIISASTIHKLAQEQVNDLPEGFKVISVGRLTHQKGFDLALEAVKKVFDKGIKFKWIIIGDGEEKKNLLEKANEYGIADCIHFLGIKENHYPYLLQSDIFLHTSRFEGFGIVVHEAKILAKPILLTDFNVARIHVEHDKSGLIAELNSDSIAENLERLILDANLRKQFSEVLSKQNFGTENEITHFYKLLEEESKQ